MAEQALFVIDKQRIIRYIDVHDSKRRPPLEALIVVVPLSVPLPGFAPIARVTDAELLVTVFPPASCKVTTG